MLCVVCCVLCVCVCVCVCVLFAASGRERDAGLLSATRAVPRDRRRHTRHQGNALTLPLLTSLIYFNCHLCSYNVYFGPLPSVRNKMNCCRPDLPNLHKYLDGKLHRSKWPQVIVFMDALPKNVTGKILRIKFAERCKMPPVDEEASPLLRFDLHF